jgi:YHS domain-containing protein
MKQSAFASGVVVFAIAMVLAGRAAFAGEEKPAEQPKAYPLKICLVTGEAIPDLDKAPKLTHDGQEFKFCCAGCIAEFNKDPAKYHKLLADKAAEEKKKAEGEKKAPEGGEKKEGEHHHHSCCE